MNKKNTGGDYCNHNINNGNNKNKNDDSTIDTHNVDTNTKDNANVITSSALDACSAVVSLHACGAASDLAIEENDSHSSSFATSSCCIGKTKSMRSINHLPSLATEQSGAPEGVISYLRSQTLISILEEKVAPVVVEGHEGERSGNGNANENENLEKRKGDEHKSDIVKDYSLLLSAADYSMGGVNHESLASLTTTRTTNNSDDIISSLSEQE